MTPYYEHGGVTIYHGDCRDVLAAGTQCDHVITDPPYDAKTHAGARNGFVGRPSISFDPLPDVHAATTALLAACRRWCVAFCSMEMLGAYAAAAGPAWVRSGFWRKPNGMPQMSGDRPGQPGEGLAIMHNPGRKRWNNGGRLAFWDHVVECHGRDHPTQKPMALMLDILSAFTDPGESVLDPYMGSGTTLVAAKNLGRSAVGIELDERYCEIAALRLAQDVLPLGLAQ